MGSTYTDHLPFYRQAQIQKRQGRTSTAGHLPTRLLVRPGTYVRCISDARTKLVADETTAPVLEPGRGETKKQTLPRAMRHALLHHTTGHDLTRNHDTPSKREDARRRAVQCGGSGDPS
ncbi:hypothetical protein B5V01_16060 [Mesorhizobium erdmanii]|uniref:Transposase IS66 central domain-containing protein n=2 Tax=Mesorhizobium TaxID=68287 RepID=A0A3M9X3V5_9HYPH|nr:hypothetical protein DNR46_27535 [Mesorhizobium japonicum]RXT44663.1 hypothetical protein B5V01_16060 [Mesorhizobium erdmanii]